MFRPDSRQPSSGDLEAVLPAAKRALLEAQWPGVFRREILPMLWEAEADFADLYHPYLGAPNKPVAVLLGILTDDSRPFTTGLIFKGYDLSFMKMLAWTFHREDKSRCPKPLHGFSSFFSRSFALGTRKPFRP